MIPANYPFILNEDGRIRFIVADERHRISSVSFRQIFPALPHLLIQLDGSFQGSNDSSFKTTTTLYSFSQNKAIPQWWDSVHIGVKDSFRYVRYFCADQCSIGDMHFYSKNEELKGKIICTGESIDERGHYNKENAFDGDGGTSYISTAMKSSWIGLDLGQRRMIDSIKFSPGISGLGPRRDIFSGRKYKLSYWKDDKWETIDSVVAINSSVTFKNLPSKGLYLLKDLTKKDVDARCFTIENGKQAWW